MRSGKDFSMPLIWDQPQLPRSIRLEVTAQQRQRKTQFLVTFRKKNPSHFWPQYHSFPWIDFQKLHEVWKGFFNAVNLRPTATSSLNSFRSYGSTKAKLSTISLFLIKEKDSSHFWPQYHSFSWIDFEKLHEVWKGFFNAVNLRATATFLLNLFRS